MEQLPIGVACDHAGLELKFAVIQALRERGFAVRDFGCHSAESMDYPDTVYPCASALSEGELQRAVVICGSGIGASITANKAKGVRCALCLEPEMGRLSREHNNANCLALAARMRDAALQLEILAAWLDEPFGGGRHEARVQKIHELSGC